MRRLLVIAVLGVGAGGVLPGCDTIHTQNTTIPRPDDPAAYRPVPMPKPLPPGDAGMPAGGAQPQTVPGPGGG